MSNLNLNELVIAYVQGNDAAFGQILRKSQQKVFSYIKQYIHDDDAANDIFQDTYFKVIQNLKLGKYNHDGKFMAWIQRIAHNLCIDSFRENKKMPKYELYYNEEEDYDVFSNMQIADSNDTEKFEIKDLSKTLNVIIAQLPYDQREIILLRHKFDMSFKEIAERNNISINTALGRMRYALANMRKLIEKNKVEITVGF